jgi:two-component system, NarL family, nitrate/nitrite response regulator NarL
MADTIEVLVVDDHALFRRGVVDLLHDEPGFAVAGEASSGPEALKLSREVKPHVVLLDVQMPGDGGVSVVQDLKQEVGARVLMLTISEKNEDLHAAIEAGADGYLLKSAEPDELCRAIRQVAAGQSVLSPEITARVMRAAVRSWQYEPAVNLSPRELEVLAELARGATTAEIANTLIISPSTVKTHIHHILEKLEAANRAEAVALATQMGLLNTPS